MADDKLTKFLKLVQNASWRHPPKVWNDQYRKALSDRLVSIGFGGSLKLTDAGVAILDHGQ